MKRLFILLFILVFVMTFSACNTETVSQSATMSEQKADEVEKAIVNNTASSDGTDDVVETIVPKADENNAETTESKVESKAETTESKVDNTNETLISRDTAINTALNAAGLTKAEVKDLDAELDYENGVKVWDVDFEKGNKEYAYEINAKTGKIVWSKVENDDEITENKANATESKADNTNETLISRDTAINTALNAAGLKKAEVRDLDAELDYEKGIKVWEVDFEKGNKEYSYEINANTGKIIWSEVDYD